MSGLRMERVEGEEAKERVKCEGFMAKLTGEGW